MLSPIRLRVGTWLCLTGLACGSETSTPLKQSASGASSSAAQSSGSGASSGSGSSAASSSASGSASSSSSVSSGVTLDGGSIACADMSTTTGTVATAFGTAELMAGASKSYFLQANWWHVFSNESEDYNGLSFTVHNAQDASVPLTDGRPLGFPSLFIGSYTGHTSQGSNLPKQVSALTSVSTVYRTNNSSIGRSNHNATYDVWFTQNGTPLPASGPGASSPGMGGAYLMVWMFKPTDRQPRGADTGHTNLTVNGVPGTWNVWIDNSTNPPCISYVSATPLDGLAFDLNSFIQDAATNQYGVTASMYLSIVFGGFEIWGGADGLALTQFCVNVQ